MKHALKIALTLLSAICIPCAFSQNAGSTLAGLYKNEDDFTVHKLSYASSAPDAIQTNDLFESPRVTVHWNGQTIHLAKKDLFGYHSGKGTDYRFYQNSIYEMLDTLAFYLYKHTGLESNPGGKGFRSTTLYYFSKKGSATLVPLTIQNLELAFSTNAKFRYALESYTRKDGSLMDYDPYVKEYKVKYFLTESLK